MSQLIEHRETLIAYMKAKIDVEDWHGVSDAANDLRVLDKEIEMSDSRQHLVPTFWNSNIIKPIDE